MEKKVHFKLHKVKKHWVTIAVTGLALGLSFAGLSYASAEEQPTPVNEATVEAPSEVTTGVSDTVATSLEAVAAVFSTGLVVASLLAGASTSIAPSLMMASTVALLTGVGCSSAEA